MNPERVKPTSLITNLLTERSPAGKIIDFEKARKALEEDRFCQKTAEERERKIFPLGLQPSSGELLELLVTIALILILLLTFLVAAFQRL